MRPSLPWTRRVSKRQKLALSLTLGLLSATTASADDGEKITVGAIFAMSGNAAAYGAWAEKGIAIGLDEINRSGGVNGKQLQVTFEDSRGQAASAVSAYKKLAARDTIRYVLSGQSSIALAIAPLANSDRVIQVDASATTPAYSTPDDYTFRVGILATDLASAAAMHIYETFETKEVAVLYIENEFGQGMLESFRAAYKGHILLTESFRSDESDYRPQILRLKKSGAKALWLVSHVKESGLLLKQMRALGVTARVYSDTYSVEGPDFLTGAGAAGEGVVYLAPSFDPAARGGRAAKFNKEYQSRFAEEATLYAAQAYDGLLVLIEAMKGCPTGDTKCGLTKLQPLDLEGASGRIRFDRNGDVKKEVTIRMVRDGQFIPYTP